MIAKYVQEKGRIFFGSLKILLKTSRILVVLFFIGFFVASHTITTIAAITSTAIAAVAGTTSTVLGRSREKTLDLSRENARLQTNLDIEKRQSSTLVAENARLRKINGVTFRGQQTTIKKATQEVLGRTMARTKRSTFANLSTIPGESIPFYGIAVVLAATAYELDAACENMSDLYELQVALDPDTARAEDKRAVCAFEVPTKQEVWLAIKQSPKAAWDNSIASLDSIADGAKQIESPEFSDMWQTFIDWIAGRFWALPRTKYLTVEHSLLRF